MTKLETLELLKQLNENIKLIDSLIDNLSFECDLPSQNAA